MFFKNYDCSITCIPALFSGFSCCWNIVTLWDFVKIQHLIIVHCEEEEIIFSKKVWKGTIKFKKIQSCFQNVFWPLCACDIARELARAEFLVDVDNMKNGISFFQELIAIMSAKAPLLLDVRFLLLLPFWSDNYLHNLRFSHCVPQCVSNCIIDRNHLSLLWFCFQRWIEIEFLSCSCYPFIYHASNLPLIP